MPASRNRGPAFKSAARSASWKVCITIIAIFSSTFGVDVNNCPACHTLVLYPMTSKETNAVLPLGSATLPNSAVTKANLIIWRVWKLKKKSTKSNGAGALPMRSWCSPLTVFVLFVIYFSSLCRQGHWYIHIYTYINLYYQFGICRQDHQVVEGSREESSQSFQHEFRKRKTKGSSHALQRQSEGQRLMAKSMFCSTL